MVPPGEIHISLAKKDHPKDSRYKVIPNLDKKTSPDLRYLDLSINYLESFDLLCGRSTVSGGLAVVAYNQLSFDGCASLQ